MDWEPMEYDRIQAKGKLGSYIIFPRKLDPNTNRYGADEEWVVSFCSKHHAGAPYQWKEIESSTSLENAKWMAENYDSYRAS